MSLDADEKAEAIIISAVFGIASGLILSHHWYSGIGLLIAIVLYSIVLVCNL